MPDMEKVIKGLDCCIKQGEQGILDCDYDCPYGEHGNRLDCWIKMNRDALALLKEDCHNCKLECLLQKYDELKEKYDSLLKEQGTEWEHLWDAPDGTFKGRCKKCGFVHFFIEGHDTQYRFCPHCGKRVK